MLRCIIWDVEREGTLSSDMLQVCQLLALALLLTLTLLLCLFLLRPCSSVDVLINAPTMWQNLAEVMLVDAGLQEQHVSGCGTRMSCRRMQQCMHMHMRRRLHVLVQRRPSPTPHPNER
jgi:hypothetical protein